MSYFPMGRTTELVARRGYEGVDGISDVLSKIGSGIKTGVKAVIGIYGAKEQAAGQAAAYQQVAAQQAPTSSGMPSWVVPAAVVGGAGVIALLVLKKRGRR